MSTKEPQYNALLDVQNEFGRGRLGLMINQAWHDDPKRLAFTFSRYKFVAKLLEGKTKVMEVGCGDGFVSRVVQQAVGKLTLLDFDPIFIEDASAQANSNWPIDAHVHDMLTGPFHDSGYDGAYALDVLEHIVAEQEDAFLANICSSLSEHGVLIIGMPSAESQIYASRLSREGHVNCKSGPDLKETMSRHFQNVFMFSMNDEVVHTGYHKMAQYVIAVAATKK